MVVGKQYCCQKSEKRRCGHWVGFADISQSNGQSSCKTGFSGEGLGRVLRKIPKFPLKMQIEIFLLDAGKISSNIQ